MAGNDNRRRKKIEAQRAKRKAQQKAIARTESSGMMARMMAAKNWPLLETRITPGLGVQGMANVLISRKGPHGQVAAVIFLVDTSCLGVKDTVLYLGSESSWNSRLIDMQERGMEFENVAPEYLRKFVEGSVEFARSFGIAPHRDWIHAAPIFGDIDASKCLTEFHYGFEGKPHFISGPNDSPDRIRRVMAALNQHAGQGHFHFTIPSSDWDDAEDLIDDDDEDEDDEHARIEEIIGDNELKS